MKEQINSIANILAIAMLADGEPDEQELSILDDIESDIEIPGLAISIKQVISTAAVLNDDQLTDLLHKNAESLDADAKPLVFEAAVTLTLADGVITEDEISNILTLAEALDIPAEKAVARLLFQVQEMEGELLVDVEDDLQDFIVVGGKTRFTSWDAYAKMLNEKKYPANLIDTLKTVNDYANPKYGSKAIVNYTPNFLTLSCTEPLSRSKTFCFVRLLKDTLKFEYNGKATFASTAAEFNETLKKEIEDYFNQLSKDKL